VGAALSYAVAALFGRRVFSGFRAEVIAAAMLTGSAVIMIPAALWQDGFTLTAASPTSIAGLIYLSVVATALAYVLYYRTLALAGAGNLSLVTLLVVPVAIGLGAIVYDETLSTEAFIGFGVLAIGMVLIDGRVLRRKILWRKS
jgi:drug/metabolite transporter (DMT)-like permease